MFFAVLNRDKVNPAGAAIAVLSKNGAPLENKFVRMLLSATRS